MLGALRCSICGQNIVGSYTSYNSGAVSLCGACASGARGALVSCAAGCGTLVRVGDRNVVANTAYNNGTVHLCASCNGGARGPLVWCAAGCGTLVRVGDRTIASCAAYNNGTVYLCAPCNGGARGPLVWCAAGCSTLVRVGERNLAANTAYNNGKVYLCAPCNGGRRGALLRCSAGCNTLVRVGDRNVAACASYNNGKVYLCAPCNDGMRGPLVWCAAGCSTLVRVGDRNVAACTSYNNGTVYLCTPCNGGARGTLLRCAAGCGRLIRVGERNVAETTQNRYSLLYMCTICPVTAIHCGVCNTPAADAQGHRFPGAGVIGNEGPNSDYRCAFCTSRMVDGQMAQKLYNQVYSWMTGRQSELGVNSQQFPRPPYTIKSRAELRGLSHLKNVPGENPVIPDLLGLCQATVRQDGSVETCNVNVERFLTQIVFLSVAAHELTHAWQYYLRFPEQTPQIREGFAEWVAVRFLRWLIAQDDTAQELRAEAQRRIDHLSNNTDPVYGAGLRDFLNREQQGLQAVLTRARQQA